MSSHSRNVLLVGTAKSIRLRYVSCCMNGSPKILLRDLACMVVED